jgi:TrmH family RNA methyltransferase
MRITSVHNPRLRSLARLRDHQERLQQRRTLVDGLREIERALQRPACVQELYWVPEHCQSPEHRRVLAQAQQQHVFCCELSEAAFRRVAYGQRCEGMVAVAAVPTTDLEGFPQQNYPLVLVLEQVEKPGNIGAVARTADAVQAGLILADPCTDAFNPNAIRASLGTIFHLPVAEGTGECVRDWLKRHAYHIVAASPDAPRVYWEVNLPERTAFVLGAEASGLSTGWSDPSITRVRLEMRGVGDSLNVSVAASVLAYEWLRQHPDPQR